MFPCLEQGELPPSCTAHVVQHSTVGMELLFTVFIKQISLVCQETTHLAVRSKPAFCLLSTCSTFTGRKGSVKQDWEFTNVCSELGIAESCHWWTWVSDLSGTVECCVPSRLQSNFPAGCIWVMWTLLINPTNTFSIQISKSINLKSNKDFLNLQIQQTWWIWPAWFPSPDVSSRVSLNSPALHWLHFEYPAPGVWTIPAKSKKVSPMNYHNQSCPDVCLHALFRIMELFVGPQLGPAFKKKRCKAIDNLVLICHLCYRPLQTWFPVFGTQFSVTDGEVESRRRWMKPCTNGLISLWVLHGADIAWLLELDHAICYWSHSNWQVVG